MKTGLAMTDDPEDKKSFLEQFNDFIDENCFPKGWDEDKKNKAKDIVKKSSTKTGMYTQIPMKCKAGKCPFAKVCPLQKADIAPLGAICPIEMKRVAEFFDGYITALDVDENNMVEASFVRDLVDIEIQTLRKAVYLSEEEFIQDLPIGVDKNGEVIIGKGLHLAVEMEDRLHKRKAAILKQLAGTREMRIKAGATVQDTAQAMASLMDNFVKLQSTKDMLVKKRLELGNTVEIEEIDEDLE